MKNPVYLGHLNIGPKVNRNGESTDPCRTPKLISKADDHVNNMKLVNWPLMGGLLHLLQRGGDWARPQPAQAPPRCIKCNSPPINPIQSNVM